MITFSSPVRLMIALSVLRVAAVASADDSVNYETDVKPVFKSRCFACHGALKQEGGLRLDTGEAIRAGGDSGPSVVVANIEESYLVERISAADASYRMPPEGEPLTEEQIALITAWIQQGAESPADEQPEPDPRDHWAFQVPVRPDVPTTADAESSDHPIDAFVAAAHERHGLSASDAAAPEVLLRRVYLDLIGLPPTRTELASFLEDPSEEKYRAVVEDLLSRAQHGERWGRHWMDVWRYSDWYGRRNVDDVRNSYPHIWRWRDWIVNSLNEDKGYDQMVREMLAADELYPDDDEKIVATGYIVRNWFSLNYDQWMRDMVEHTGKAFLGLRMNCALCHDHKYDPISQRDYFAFRAFFEPLEIRQDRVPGGPALPKLVRYTPGSGASLKPTEAGLARIYEEYLDAETRMYALGDQRILIDDEPAVAPGTPEFLAGDPIELSTVQLPPVAHYPGLKPFVQQAEINERQKVVDEAETQFAAARQAMQQAESALTAAQFRLLIAAREYLETPEPVEAESPDGRVARNGEEIGFWRFEGANDESGFLADWSGNGHTLARVEGGDPSAAPFVIGTDPKGLGFSGSLPPDGRSNGQAARFEQRQSYAYLAAAGSSEFHADQFTLEALVHFETASQNFNRTIADYEGAWTILHRGLDESRYELRIRYINSAGEARDVATASAEPPLVLDIGVDYAIAVTMGETELSIFVQRLDGQSALQLTSFPRNGDGVDMTSLGKPDGSTQFKIGNSDGTGRVVGLIDEVRYSQGALSPEAVAAALTRTPGDTSRALLAAAVAAVESSRSAIEVAQADVQVKETAHAHAQAELESVNQRVHADKVRYLGAEGDPDAAARTAAHAERTAAHLATLTQVAVAEKTLQEARSKLPADAMTSDDVTAAETALSKAQEAAEAARVRLDEESTDYSPLGPTYKTTSTGRRTALAHWIASERNPLTARVAVNHIWMHHFGRPLVGSVYDFGRSGDAPTHPELLDWLAVEFMEHGWSMKHLHRLIVTSRTYRQASQPASTDDPNLAIDPDNVYWWRRDRRRMEAELLRDSVLYVTGMLDMTLGGHEIDNSQGQKIPRRSMYFSVFPEAGGVDQFLAMFDPADPCDCYRRTESIVPQQALAMANGQLTLNGGRRFAGQLWETVAAEIEQPDDREGEFVSRAFETVLSRGPTPDEAAACGAFLAEQRRLFTSVSTEQLTGQTSDGVQPASTDPDQRARESLIRVLLNHHDFVTIH
ncbi:MAG: DUF1553 domain-containing protein [Planctomycetota bacterium]|nr:MAG: DUF1553 domain-containing protein [Planctomycetota bacterium]